MPDPYWSQFAHVWTFTEERPKVEGVLEGRKQGGPRDDPYPVLMLRTDSGYKLLINVTQTRLLAELVRHRPDVGDRLTIVYDGTASKAPPGMNPTKEFTVEVTRKGQPQAPKAS
jgi:hypothetical protein